LASLLQWFQDAEPTNKPRHKQQIEKLSADIKNLNDVSAAQDKKARLNASRFSADRCRRSGGTKSQASLWKENGRLKEK
jgi:hypothetical protein